MPSPPKLHKSFEFFNNVNANMPDYHLLVGILLHFQTQIIIIGN